jgi:transposase
MTAGADLLLRQVRSAVSPSRATPRILGVDEWAWRKGYRYGTILCDLEQRQVVDLLPDASARTFAEWLRARPGVEVIARDRAERFVDGATVGAPEAIQVADRWHLLHNLREMVERFLNRHRSDLSDLVEALKATRAAQADEFETDLESVELPSTQAQNKQEARLDQRIPRRERDRLACRERRQASYEWVLELSRQGLSNRQIATAVGLNRDTISTDLRAGTFPEIALRDRRARKRDPYRGYLEACWKAERRTNVQLFNEIQALGYSGSQTLVADWASQQPKWWRELAIKQAQKRCISSRPSAVSPDISLRKVRRLLLSPLENLEGKERLLLDHFFERSASARRVQELGRRFPAMVRQREPEALPAWLEEARQTDIAELGEFVRGIARDYQAVEAGLRLPWSNGPVEGNINRLKLIKRQMYGRAGFELLRRRVLEKA